MNRPILSRSKADLKQRQGEALALVRQAFRAREEATADLEQARRQLQAALIEARKHASLAEIAEVLGLSRERVFRLSRGE